MAVSIAVPDVVVRELARLDNMIRAIAATGGIGAITWRGVEFQIDGRRYLVLDEVSRRVGAELGIAQDARRGSRRSAHTVWDLVDLLAGFLVDQRAPSALVACDFLNYAVMQPMVNPAFASLLWLGLDQLASPHAATDRLEDVLGPIAYDLSRYPESRSEALDVRAAQLAFVRDVLGVDVGVAPWLDVADDVWALRCREILQDRGADVAWEAIRRQANRLEAEKSRAVAEAAPPPADRLVTRADGRVQFGEFAITPPQEWGEGRAVNAQVWGWQLEDGAYAQLGYAGWVEPTKIVERWRRQMSRTGEPEVTVTDGEPVTEFRIVGTLAGKPDQVVTGACIRSGVMSSGHRAVYELAVSGSRPAIDRQTGRVRAMIATLSSLR